MERAVSALEAARNKQHLSRKEVAERIGVDRATLSRWERGGAQPRTANLRQLCEAYDMTAQELGFEHGGSAESISQVEIGSEIRAYIADNLTMRLLALAFAPSTSFMALCSKMTLIIEECTKQMDITKAQMTRREALRNLVTVPLMTMNLTSFSQGKPHTHTMHIEDILAQCASGIAACGELSRGKDASDLALAYDGLSAYFPVLKEIVKDSTPYRKQAAALATRCVSVKTLLAWHLQGASHSVKYAQDAVEYSEISEDVLLQLSALKYQAWAYGYDSSQGSKDLQAMQKALLLLRDHKAEVPLSVHGNIYSSLAYMQAKHGQQCMLSLRQAEKAALCNESASLTEPPIPALIHNICITLYQQHDYNEGLRVAKQIINPQTLAAKMPMSERTRIEAINAMTMALLKSKEKNKEQTLFYWQAGIQGARTLRSEQRFNEALLSYHIMEALWPGDKSILDLHNLVVHW